MSRARLLLFSLLLLLPAVARADFADHYARRDDVGEHKAPVSGRSRVLVVPVEVQNLTHFNMPATRAFFESDLETGLRNYYRVVSGGKLELDVKVIDPITYATCPLPAQQFPGCVVQRGDVQALKAALDMLRDVFKRVDAVVDLKEFDLNGAGGAPDGYADLVILVTNMPFGGIGFPLYFLNDGDNLAGGSGGPFVLDGVKLPTVAIGGNERNGMVLLHEAGHLLGLTDLYSEADNYPGLHFTAMGDWLYDYYPPLFDPESRYRLGWQKVKTVSGTVRVTVAPASAGGDVYKLGTGQEYFLVENRGPSGGFDKNVKGRGLAVFHVDRRVGPKPDDGEFVFRLLQCVNCDAWHPYLMNVPANGRFDLQNDKAFKDQDLLFAEGQSLGPDESGEPLSATHQVASTNFYDGKPSGIRIEDIKQVGESFEVTLTAPETDTCAEKCNVGVCPESECVRPPPPPETPPAAEPEGCGCSSATAGAMPFAALAWALARRRRASRPRSFRASRARRRGRRRGFRASRGPGEPAPRPPASPSKSRPRKLVLSVLRLASDEEWRFTPQAQGERHALEGTHRRVARERLPARRSGALARSPSVQAAGRLLCHASMTAAGLTPGRSARAYFFFPNSASNAAFAASTSPRPPRTRSLGR